MPLFAASKQVADALSACGGTVMAHDETAQLAQEQAHIPIPMHQNAQKEIAESINKPAVKLCIQKNVERR